MIETEVPGWWADTPAHVRRYVEETAGEVRRTVYESDDPNWWLPVVERLLAHRVLTSPLDYDRELRSARALAETQLVEARKEMAELRRQVSVSETVAWKRRAVRAAQLCRTERKTVSVATLSEALELDPEAFGLAFLSSSGGD